MTEMGMRMTARELVALFQRMLDEHWRYVLGAAETGTVDCSGAVVWAYRQRGLSVYHGSNRLAREEAVKMLPVSMARPGMLAFKARPPGVEGYALPDKYREGGSRSNGDLMDYYHVGVVDSDERYVLNAQSTRTGFVRSLLSEGWASVAYARQIDYGGEEGDTMNGIKAATVRANSGTTVNLRKTPGGDLLDRVPVGATVTVTDTGGEWSHVEYDGKSGWMMSKFLETDDAEGEPDGAADERIDQLEERVGLLEKRILALEGGVG